MQQIERHQQELIEVHQQLLFALAAIERKNEALDCAHYALTHKDSSQDFAIDACRDAHDTNVDLSLLHQHDAEVRKPVVEALKGAKALIGFLQSCIRSEELLNPKDSQYIRSVLDQCDAVLAQCKEGE